jgi:hypothetical protein
MAALAVVVSAKCRAAGAQLGASNILLYLKAQKTEIMAACQSER